MRTRAVLCALAAFVVLGTGGYGSSGPAAATSMTLLPAEADQTLASARGPYVWMCEVD
jgi:hypothetical protein